MIRSKILCIPLAAALFITACGDDDATTDGSTETTTETAAFDETVGAEVVSTYADGVFSSYEVSVASATAMSTAIEAFLAAPTEESLTAARTAWLDARDDYGVTEAYRFYGGPIDNEETGPEGQINAWPMDESYVDYVEGNATSGIVNDAATYPTIDAELLASLNEVGGETNISTGWHAIEFLLWGQDLSETGPGARAATDYTTAPNADRRGAYLAAATGLLITDLQGLADAWDPEGGDNYRTEFLALPLDEALTNIVTGVGELSRGELGGERLSVAYTERSQEDEHSCFSDNTTNDVIANAQGIVNVVTGTYPGDVTGPGLSALISASDEAAGAALTEAVEASRADAELIPAPFDQHLRDGVSDTDPGRVSILTTIEALGVQTDLIVASAAELGLTIEVS